MIVIRDKKLSMIVNLFIEILQNYIDKFTIYNIPSFLQLIHFNNQLQNHHCDNYKIFHNIIDELSQIDKLLELRNLNHLKICPNLSQLLVNLLAPNTNFIKTHDKILTCCYKSSISYKEYINEMSDDDHEPNILKDDQFLKYHRDRLLRLKINERKIFGG